MFQEEIGSDIGYTAELAWCPECQSPPSDSAHVAYCTSHMPTTCGESDRLVDTAHYIFNGEGGDGGQAFCEFIHRDRKETP